MSEAGMFIQHDLSVSVRPDDVVEVTDEVLHWTYAESFRKDIMREMRGEWSAPRELLLAGAVMMATHKVLEHRGDHSVRAELRTKRALEIARTTGHSFKEAEEVLEMIDRAVAEEADHA